MPDLARAEPCPSLHMENPNPRFVDDTGGQWRVFDCLTASQRLVVLGAGSHAAELRVFISATGAKRIYQFQASESRVLDLPSIVRQFEEAETN